MKKTWLVLAAALGMMAATGAYLGKIHIRLGAAGVKVGPGPLYDELGHLAARQRVILPDSVLGMKGADERVTRGELDNLPKDTTFGRKMYSNGNFSVSASVVLMGTDRTSIHQPQYCLDAQGWHIEKTDLVMLPMDKPYSYEVPALRLTASQETKDMLNTPGQVKGLYVYWFVSADRITPDEGTRMWSLARTMVEKGVLERWAYISYFATCNPGQEEITYRKLEQFIHASVPQFQTVVGKPLPGRKVAAR